MKYTETAKKVGREISKEFYKNSKSKSPKYKRLLKKAKQASVTILIPKYEEKPMQPAFKQVVEEDRRNFFLR